MTGDIQTERMAASIPVCSTTSGGRTRIATRIGDGIGRAHIDMKIEPGLAHQPDQVRPERIHRGVAIASSIPRTSCLGKRQQVPLRCQSEVEARHPVREKLRVSRFSGKPESITSRGSKSTNPMVSGIVSRTPGRFPDGCENV